MSNPVPTGRYRGKEPFMTTTHVGLFVGLILGLVATFGGFTHFLIVILFGLIGLVVGRVLDGKLDLQALFGRASDRR